ncbi:MAG: hypothetical protein VX716_08795, partial [SAR324 cluster bacterium]|nr:hypothetical protein [SAR324 cluster bacterium]
DPLSGPRWQIHCQDERSPNRRWEIDPQSLMWEGQKGASQLLALSWRAPGNSLAVGEHWKKILDSVVQAYSFVIITITIIIITIMLIILIIIIIIIITFELGGTSRCIAIRCSIES